MVALVKDIREVRKPKVYTFEQYLRREEKSAEKHEFYNGKIIKMAGGTYIHSLIASNTVTALNLAVFNLPQKYYIHGSDLKIRIEQSNIGIYPDALVICQEHEFWQDRFDVITNPLAVVEVLSPSTQTFDRLGKFELYKLIPSFKEYVLINTDNYSVETRFLEEPDLWRIKTEKEINKTIHLRSLDVSIALQDIYKNIVLPLEK